MGSKLVVHDLATGQSRGTSDVPAEATAVASRCKEIIFSRDGNHLATLVIASDQQSVCLLEWDFASGKLTQNKRWELSAWLRQLSDFSPAHEEHPLVPLPEGGGYVLFGRLIWKPNADLPEQAFPLGTDNYPRATRYHARGRVHSRSSGRILAQRTGPHRSRRRGHDHAEAGRACVGRSMESSARSGTGDTSTFRSPAGVLWECAAAALPA